MSVADSVVATASSATPNASTVGVPSSRRIPWAEASAFAMGLTALVLIELVVLRATPALTRPLWLDEIHTNSLLLPKRRCKASAVLALGRITTRRRSICSTVRLACSLVAWPRSRCGW